MVTRNKILNDLILKARKSGLHVDVPGQANLTDGPSASEGKLVSKEESLEIMKALIRKKLRR